MASNTTPPTMKSTWIKTLWNGLMNFFSVLLIPLMIGVFTIVSSIQQSNISQDQQRAAILQTYMDNIQDLLLNHNLLKSDGFDPSNPYYDVAVLARARTLTALQGLDPERKGRLLIFLHEAQLISLADKKGKKTHNPIINLSYAHLEDADLSSADLTGADLSNAYLEGANLWSAGLLSANLQYAHLEQAVLSGAYLQYAYLYGVYLTGADLTGADLSRANLWSTVNLTQQQLDHVSSCTNAILPIKPPRLICHHSQTPSIYYGIHVPGWLNNLSAVTTFENDAKKKVSLVMFHQGWGLTDGTQNFETDWMNNVRNHGAIPMVTWEPWLYTNGTNQPQYSLKNIINGKFDAYITQWADASKTWGHPYFLRFAEEMNGNWFPWSEQVNGNQPGQYVLAWKHVHTLFVNDGVTNVTWVWSANIENTGSTPLSEIYPGDDYVDWLGMDGYNWGTVNGYGWETFSQVFSQTYKDILGISQKPLMVSEAASTEQGGNKANWIMDAYTTQVSSNFPNIKAVIWFNENKETDWRIESSSTAQTAFATAIRSSTYASNNYASLNASPIPPPPIPPP